MSLFPAYGAEARPQTPCNDSKLQFLENEPSSSWLSNTSFQPDVIPSIDAFSNVTIESSDDEIVDIICKDKEYNFITPDFNTKLDQCELPSLKKSKKFKKKSKHHSKHHKNNPNYDLNVTNVYFDDKFRDKGNFKVNTLCTRVRPLYHLNTKPIGFIQSTRETCERLNRYYKKSVESKSKAGKYNRIITKTKSEIEELDKFNNDKKMKEQNAVQLKIKEFNQKLAEEPTNIELWLQYANLEDHNEFENCSNSSDIERLKYQRKLAIIEKAMDINFSSSELLMEKLKFISELVPADQYCQQIEVLINKDSGNILLWQALITATRQSVAICTVPKIQSLYLKCFGTLHLWSKACQQLYDNRLLNILYQSIIFLRHAGLWEQMWESIRLNLNLNLNMNNKNKHYLPESIDEKKIIDMEEVILRSKLPLNQLWLRIELLRENCHWMSVERNQIEFVGDSHRFVSPEDIAEYVHPLLTRESNLKMVIFILIALKVPILPLRHITRKYLEMDDKSWTIDSIESILPILYPCVGEMAGHNQRLLISKELLQDRLTSGPQYLRNHPAQELFLDFIRNVFHTVAEQLKPQDRRSINIWWLRFERMLITLRKIESINCDKVFKKLRGNIKEFLKKDENRNSLHYYREYALLEHEIGRLNNSMNILKMAIQTKGNVIKNINDNDERTALMSLYRALLQLLLDERTWNELTSRNDIIKVFCQMSTGQSETECLISTEKYLHTCYTEFIENIDSLPADESLNDSFLPNFYSDVITCYIYLLYVTHRPFTEITQIFDRCITITKEKAYLQERFYENKIMFLQLINEKNHNLQNAISEAMKYYPNNCYILSVFAEIESKSPYWNVSIYRKGNELWPTLAMCLAGRARLHSTISLNDPAAMSAALNKLLHYHEKLSALPNIRYCPLIWRLYMLLLREHNLCEKKGEDIYHASIAQCPWARSIYVDAAEIAPHLLTQIQDVIREKDLRMHVTLEELDILRG